MHCFEYSWFDLCCKFLRDNVFLELTHSFKRCKFNPGKNSEELPNMIGLLRKICTKLNGIVIDYAETSCTLKLDEDGNPVKEIEESSDKFGLGFDIILDDFLIRSKLYLIWNQKMKFWPIILQS